MHEKHSMNAKKIHTYKEAKTIYPEEEDYLFVATCFTSMSSTNRWLINNGCLNHMTHNKSLFKEWCEITSSMVRVGNGKYIAVKGKGTIAILTYHGTKSITNVLYVPDIDQNLSSVGQMVEKGYKVLFNNDCCLIKDANDNYLFRIKMKGKSFFLNPFEEEQIAFSVTQVELDSLNIGKTEQNTKKRGRKPNSSMNLIEPTDSPIGSEEFEKILDHKKDQSNEGHDAPCEDPPSMEAVVPPKNEKKMTPTQLSSSKALENDSSLVASSSLGILPT